MRRAILDTLGLDMTPPTETERLYVERLAASALDPVEAAQSVGMTEQDVVRLYAKPEVMRLMQTRLVAASMPWKAMLAKAKTVLWRNMDHQHPAVQADAAKTVVMALKGSGLTMADAAEAEDTRTRQDLVNDVLMLQEKVIDITHQVIELEGEQAH